MATFVLCLIIMAIVTLISILTGNDFVSNTISESITSTQTLNSTSTDLSTQALAGTLDLDPIIQAVVWITIIGLIAVGSGIAVLGSGLNERATHWLTHLIFAVAIWSLLSSLSFPLITSIEIVGGVIYLILTIVYAISFILWTGSRG